MVCNTTTVAITENEDRETVETRENNMNTNLTHAERDILIEALGEWVENNRDAIENDFGADLVEKAEELTKSIQDKTQVLGIELGTPTWDELQEQNKMQDWTGSFMINVTVRIPEDGDRPLTTSDIAEEIKGLIAMNYDSATAATADIHVDEA